MSVGPQEPFLDLLGSYDMISQHMGRIIPLSLDGPGLVRISLAIPLES